MRCREYLEELDSRLTELVERGKIIGRRASDDQLNFELSRGKRTMGQIFEHMRLTHAPYLSTIQRGLGSASPASEQEMRLTLVGKILMRAAGPDGNAPMPKAVVPRPGPYSQDIVESWIEQTTEILQCVELAKGRDICGTRVRNPFVPLLRMNLVDCFGILVEHTERHVRQIESLAERSMQPDSL